MDAWAGLCVCACGRVRRGGLGGDGVACNALPARPGPYGRRRVCTPIPPSRTHLHLTPTQGLASEADIKALEDKVAEVVEDCVK